MFGNFVPGFTIWRLTSANTGSGQFSNSRVDTGQAVSGRLSALSALSSNEVILGGQQTSRSTHKFACDSSVDLKPQDEIRGGPVTVIVESLSPTSSSRRIEARCYVDKTGA
ncbi:MAG: hypothetical protein AAF479_05935 [Pseudomonadota bacterium]